MVLVNQTSLSGIRIELSKPNSTSMKDNPIHIRYIPVLNLSVFWLLLLYSFLGFRKLQSIVLPCEEYHKLLSQRISLLPTRRYHLWTQAFQQSFGSHTETFLRETRPPELQPGMLEKHFNKAFQLKDRCTFLIPKYSDSLAIVTFLHHR